MTSGGEMPALADRLRWDRRRNPYAGWRGYSQHRGRAGRRCDILLAAGQACHAGPPYPNPKTLVSWRANLAFDGPGWPETKLSKFGPGAGRARTGAPGHAGRAARAGGGDR